MHIALLSAEYPPQPGGIGDYTQRLGQALAARGHTVSVLTIVDSRFRIIDVAHPDTDHAPQAHIRTPDWGFGCWGAVIAALGQLRPHVLHIQYQTGAYAMHPAINLLPWRLRRLPQRPRIVVTAHDLRLPYLFPKAHLLRRWVTRRLLADADRVIVTNEADYIQTTGRRPRVAGAWAIAHTDLIPIGSNVAVAPPADYDRAAWRARLGVRSDETLIAYFGLISRTKGLDTLLKALAHLPPDMRLMVVGGAAAAPQDRAYAAGLQHQMDGLREQGRLILAGYAATPLVSAHLLAADMAALPFTDGASFRRGSLLAVLAHGLPLVTTGDTRRIASAGLASPRFPRLVDGDHALLVPPTDAPALAAALRRLANDPGLRARLGQGGRALAARFSWEEIAARHAALYAEIVRQSF